MLFNSLVLSQDIFLPEFINKIYCTNLRKLLIFIFVYTSDLDVDGEALAGIEPWMVQQLIPSNIKHQVMLMRGIKQLDAEGFHLPVHRLETTSLDDDDDELVAAVEETERTIEDVPVEMMDGSPEATQPEPEHDIEEGCQQETRPQIDDMTAPEPQPDCDIEEGSCVTRLQESPPQSPAPTSVLPRVPANQALLDDLLDYAYVVFTCSIFSSNYPSVSGFQLSLNHCAF